MLPSPAAGGLSSTAPSTTMAAGAVVGPGSAPAAAAAAAAAAGAKRPAASDLQQRSAGAAPTKRHATAANRASISGPPSHMTPTTPSTSASAFGQSPHGHGQGSHVRSRSHAAPTMTVSTAMTPAAPQQQAPPQPHQAYPYPSQPQSAFAVVTEDQLVGKTPDQLVATILQIQSQHQHYVAQLSAQYDNISQQLNELRASLLAFYGGQAACNQAAASALNPREPTSSTSSRQIFAPPPFPVQTPRPSTSHSRNSSTRMPPTSPPSQSDPRLLPKPPGQSSQTPGPPPYEYRTVATVEEVWREYREGMDGQPAIEDLDATWGSRWRPEPRGRTWYSRRKVIWDKIKEFIESGMDEDEAVREVEKLRDGGTINKLIRMLQEEKKDKGIGDDGMTQ